MKNIAEIDKKKILQLIKKGKNTKEIRGLLKYRYTRQQIAAIRAWETMRNSELIPKTKSLTDVIRNRIIKMIDKGVSTTDIIKRLKNQYSRQQIAAVRAHVTMGNY